MYINSNRSLEIESSYTAPSYSMDEVGKKRVTPTQFWRFFREDEFEEETLMVASGKFARVKKAKFKDAAYLIKKNKPTTYAGQFVALKDPVSMVHDFVAEEYSLSHEVSCTVILHPNIVNYIGGLRLGKGIPNDAWRVGIVMEYVDFNLRTCIEKNPALKELQVQLQLAKQIASGMNFLHSLNPYVLHRDLRCPNILVNNDLVCKIADFGISNNLGYKEMQSKALYTSLIPPECRRDQAKFTKKGDVYFYGWVLVEMLIGRQPDEYSLFAMRSLIDLTLSEEKHSKYKDLILMCLHDNPDQRPYFVDILRYLDEILDVKFNPETVIQTNNMRSLKEAVSSGTVTPETKDALGRNLIHQACIFGNLEALEYLVSQWGISQLKVRDKFDCGTYHFAGRNGWITILKFLDSKGMIANDKESRFQTTALDLTIAMKHFDCADILIAYADQETLNCALQSTSQEGNLELVKKFVQFGANLECQAIDNRASPLDRAAFNGHLDVVAYLLEKGAVVDQTRNDGSTPLWNASQNGHTAVIELLLKFGANLNKARSYDGTSPVYMAALKGHTDTVEFLLKNGADPNLARTDTGSTPLFFAAQKGFKKVVELLLQYGANPNHVRTHDGATPLFMASQYGHKDIVNILLSHNVDVNHKNDYSKTALMVCKNEEIKEILEAASARSKK